MLSFLESRKDTFVDDLASPPYMLNVKRDPAAGLVIAKQCYASNLTSPVVKDCNSTILTEDGSVVCYTGYTPVMVNMEHINDTASLFPHYSFSEMIDGTVIRLFYHQNEWRVATRNHTDAGKCRWNSSKTFRELWDECLVHYPEFHTDLLDVSMTYMFVIQHPDNEQVIQAQECAVYLVDVYDTGTLTRLLPELVDESITSLFLRPKELEFQNPRDLYIFLSLDDPSIKGVILHPDTDAIEDDTVCYVLTNAYSEAMREYAIPNVSDIFRKRAQTPIYSDFQNKQLEYNTVCNVGVIHSMYVSKYVHHKQITTLPEHDKYLTPIHSYYKRNDRRGYGEGRCVINRYVVENLMYVIDETFGGSLLPEHTHA